MKSENNDIKQPLANNESNQRQTKSESEQHKRTNFNLELLKGWFKISTTNMSPEDIGKVMKAVFGWGSPIFWICLFILGFLCLCRFT